MLSLCFDVCGLLFMVVKADEPTGGIWLFYYSKFWKKRALFRLQHHFHIHIPCMFSWAATCASGNTLKVHSAPQLMVCGSAMLHLVGMVSETWKKSPYI